MGSVLIPALYIVIIGGATFECDGPICDVLFMRLVMFGMSVGHVYPHMGAALAACLQKLWVCV